MQTQTRIDLKQLSNPLSDVRIQIVQAMGELSQYQVSACLLSGMSEPADAELAHEFCFSLGAEILDFTEMQFLTADSHIFANGYVRELMQLNAVPVWRNLLKLTLPDESDMALLEKTAVTISRCNRSLYGLSTITIGLACLYGRHFEKILRPRHQEKPGPIIRAAKKIGDCFEPANRQSDLIRRLITVFRDESDAGAFAALAQTDAYRNTTGTCPALKLSRKLLTAYPEVLYVEQYLDHFMDRTSPHFTQPYLEAADLEIVLS